MFSVNSAVLPKAHTNITSSMYNDTWTYIVNLVQHAVIILCGLYLTFYLIYRASLMLP